ARIPDGGGFRAREFLKWGVVPNLPEPVLRLLARARGRERISSYVDRAIPWWFRKDFVRSENLEERASASSVPLESTSWVQRETEFFMRCPWFWRISSTLHRSALAERVELRSPLLDNRVVDFAFHRPWHERTSMRESKVLLRRSMAGLLPDEVLA